MGKLYEESLKSVYNWRANGYEGATGTTKRLFEYWFKEEHNFEDGTKFEFWDCQQEAIETLVYLYEVHEYHSLYELSRGFNVDIDFDPTEDNWPNYCFKMATGSGKTFVMGMAIVWQYFNTLFEERDDVTNKFLLVAPNLIVLDRLLGGFEGEESVYNEFPFFIPDEWKSRFNYQVIRQSDNVPSHKEGIIHVTNVHQLYERGRNSDLPEDNPIQKQLGSKPVQGEEFKDRTELKDILGKYDKVIALNDEAHHAHVETKWNEALKDINGENDRLLMQLDFTATAWDQAKDQQVPLPHIVYNYPLERAIDDNIVKDPHIAYIENAQRPASDDFIRERQPEIHAAIEYLEKQKESFSDLNKKPVLFAVCDNTNHANELAEYFRDNMDYGDKVLLIHTYVRGSKYGRKGDIKKDQKEQAREAAKNIDDNKYEIIVSVMMLQEGWDVRNVTTILPLRAFESNILVEQTLGRGLRRMFPHEPDAEGDLYVIEHPNFVDFWEDEEEIVDVNPTDKAYRESHSVYVDEDKLEYNFTIPILKGGITQTSPDIKSTDVRSLSGNEFSLDDIDILPARVIEERLRDHERVGSWEFAMDFAPTQEEYFSYLTKAILKKAGSQSQFSELLPKVRKYVKNRLFEKNIVEIDEDTLKRLNHWLVRDKVVDVFVKKLNNLGRTRKEHDLTSSYNLKDTKPFHTKKPVYETRKTVFNQLPYPKTSEMEAAFMRYLDHEQEVKAYTKVLRRFPIYITYYDEEKGLRSYVPDFIVKTEDKFYVIETKGEPFDQMATPKKNAAVNWCKSLSERTDNNWEYAKIMYDDFGELRGHTFEQLIKAVR